MFKYVSVILVFIAVGLYIAKNMSTEELALENKKGESFNTAEVKVTKTHKYEQVFFDKTKRNTLQDFHSQQHIHDIDERSKKIISDIEQRISQKKLTDIHKQLSEESQQKIELASSKLNKLKKQLEELEYEN
jgi:ABC-type phosphate transport system auxiliary subunit